MQMNPLVVFFSLKVLYFALIDKTFDLWGVIRTLQLEVAVKGLTASEFLGAHSLPMALFDGFS